MNKKNLLHLMTIMMVAMLSFGFASCSSDDDEEKAINSPIVGTWKITAPSLEYILQFSSQGNVSLSQKVDSKRKTSTGTYEVSEGNDCIAKIYWNDSDTPEFWEITVSGNKMTTKSIFSSSTLTWTKQ